MAIFNEQIKGYKYNNEKLTDHWTYIKWGENSLPTISDGGDNDWGYLLANNAKAEITQSWAFRNSILLGENDIEYILKVDDSDKNVFKISKYHGNGDNTDILTVRYEGENEDKNDGLITSNYDFSIPNLTIDGDLSIINKVTITDEKIDSAIPYISENSYVQATYFNATSDKRAKDNIQSADFGAVDVIINTPVYTFNYKEQKDTIPGIIAQDLLKTQPTGLELVNNIDSRGEKGDYMSIKESKLIFILWKAIQEQQEAINKLQSEIENLKK